MTTDASNSETEIGFLFSLENRDYNLFGYPAAARIDRTQNVNNKRRAPSFVFTFDSKLKILRKTILASH